jgi:phage/plasmid-associated DNA primase
LSSKLYFSWKKWSENRGEYPGSQKAFSKSLDERGLKHRHGMNGMMFYGIAVKSDDREEDERRRYDADY